MTMWRLALVCCALCVGCESTNFYQEKTPEWFGASADASHTTTPQPPAPTPAPKKTPTPAPAATEAEQ
jgi:hypothetical protein